MVAIKILEKSKTKMKFIIESDIGMANALRRIMMNEIPVLAVETVIFEENNSGLFDEVVAHRLGMIPIGFDPKTLNMKKDCKCNNKGCARCQVRMKLEKAGPSIITTSDIVCDLEMEKNIPIVELLENQRIKLEAIAELDIGTEHAKNQSAIVGYKEEKGTFKFIVESVCGLDAQQILDEALSILEERSDEFLKDFKKAVK